MNMYADGGVVIRKAAGGENKREGDVEEGDLYHTER